MHAPRYAIYFVPASDTSLGAFGAAVVGYDADRGQPVPHLQLAGIGEEEAARATAGPAQYGFHATLKAPFRLRDGTSAQALLRAVEENASGRTAVAFGPLRVEWIGAFFALRPARDSAALDALAADCVQAFDSFRAPIGADERAKRVAAGLTPRQTELLDRWGYPYVMDEFRFHMTLTGPLPQERRDPWQQALIEAYRPHAREDVVLDELAVVEQEAPTSRFRVIHRAPLKG